METTSPLWEWQQAAVGQLPQAIHKRIRKEMHQESSPPSSWAQHEAAVGQLQQAAYKEYVMADASLLQGKTTMLQGVVASFARHFLHWNVRAEA